MKSDHGPVLASLKTLYCFLSSTWHTDPFMGWPLFSCNSPLIALRFCSPGKGINLLIKKKFTFGWLGVPRPLTNHACLMSSLNSQYESYSCFRTQPEWSCPGGSLFQLVLLLCYSPAYGSYWKF